MALRQPTSPRKHRLVAVYQDAEHARAAIKTLERAGVDGVHIGLDSLEELNLDVRTEERRATGHVFRRVVVGVILGAFAGALIGFLVGLVYSLVTTGDPIGPAVVVGVIVCAFGGSAAGGVYGGIAGVGMTPGWEKTFAAGPGQVCVSVRSDDPADLERARGVIDGTHPVDVNTDDETE